MTYDVPICDEVIRLGQFLKLANLVDSGAQAKPVIAEGRVQVNGEVETRRGRQLRRGDVVTLLPDPEAPAQAAPQDQSARVVDEASFDDGLPW